MSPDDEHVTVRAPTCVEAPNDGAS